MSHQCRSQDSSTVCLQIGNELWVKEHADISQREGRTYKVNFCPECGFKIPTSKTFKNFLNSIPDSTPHESITQFSQALSTAIAQMNHNVELIKCFMISQNKQNQCFMDRGFQLSQDICKLERQILNIEKTLFEKEKP